MPVLNNVRYASDSDHSRYESELTLWATRRHYAARKTSLFDHLVGGGEKRRVGRLRRSLLGRTRADRLRLALVLHVIGFTEHFLMQLAVRAFHHLGEIFVHDDVASLRIDHDRSLRTVERPAEQ